MKGTHTGSSGWRIVRRAALHGAVGVFMSIASASLCLMYVQPVQVRAGGGVNSADLEGRAPGTVAFVPGQVYRGFGFEERMDYWTWAADGSAPPNWARLVGAGVPSVSCGWPFHAFGSPAHEFPAVCDAAEWDASVKRAYDRATTSGVLPGWLHAKAHRVLPTRPLYMGLAANSVLFAAVVGGVVFGVAATRRAIRRRGGRCVHCGYPVVGRGVCPECGAASPGAEDPGGRVAWECLA